MKIATLAWGSLVWDVRELAISGPFLAVGPELPFEFSRVSRDSRLTLVVDESVGAMCTTFAAPCAIDDLDRALTDLWNREGSGVESTPGNIRASGRVGFVHLRSGEQNASAVQRHPKSVEAVQRWGADHGYDAVIWTALASNFKEKTGSAFSVDAALQQLDRLDKLSFARALNYIWCAPPQIQTPLRTAVNKRWPRASL